jgi:hypothetical protein
MRITKTVGLCGSTVEELANEIDVVIGELAAAGLTVVDIRYAAFGVGASEGGWESHNALLLIGEAA